MSIFLLLPSVAVLGTLNVSLVSHRIIKITDKKVLLGLLPANTKLFLPVPFLILCAVQFYTTQMFWHFLFPVKNYSISYLITHTAKLDFSQKINQQSKKPYRKNMIYRSEFPLISLRDNQKNTFKRTLSVEYFPAFHSPPQPNAGRSSCAFVIGVMVNTRSRQGGELIIQVSEF